MTTRADALSRNNLPLFTSLHTQVGQQPTANSHPRAPSLPTNCVQTKLDITTLDQAVDHYFLNGLAASTQKSYRFAKRRYLQFCQPRGLVPVPDSEHQLCMQFVAFLAIEKLCRNTIKCYLAAIRHLHIAVGAGDPGISHMPKLEQVLKGIKSSQAKEKSK